MLDNVETDFQGHWLAGLADRDLREPQTRLLDRLTFRIEQPAGNRSPRSQLDRKRGLLVPPRNDASGHLLVPVDETQQSWPIRLQTKGRELGCLERIIRSPEP